MALNVKVGEFVVVVLRCCINWYQMPVEATRFFFTSLFMILNLLDSLFVNMLKNFRILFRFRRDIYVSWAHRVGLRGVIDTESDSAMSLTLRSFI